MSQEPSWFSTPCAPLSRLYFPPTSPCRSLSLSVRRDGAAPLFEALDTECLCTPWMLTDAQQSAWCWLPFVALYELLPHNDGAGGMREKRGLGEYKL